jgi:hypothetical protein
MGRLGRLDVADCFPGCAGKAVGPPSVGIYVMLEMRTSLAQSLAEADLHSAGEHRVVQREHMGLTPDGGHLTGGTAGPAGRLSVCRASVGSTPRSSGSRLPAW